MKRYVFSLIAAAGCCAMSAAYLLADGQAASTSAPATQPAAKLSAEQIKAMISKLNAPEADAREDAEKLLIQAGPDALEALQDAAKSDVPEVQVRAKEAIKAINAEIAAAKTKEMLKNFLWSCPIEDCAGGTPIIIGDKAYVASADGKLHAVDRKTGKEAWATTLPDNSSLLNAGEKVIVANSQGNFVTAFDPKDGKQLWQKDLSQPKPQAGTPETEPAVYPENYDFESTVAGDLILVRPRYGLLTALKAGSGDEAWNIDGKLAEIIMCPPAVSGGTLYLARNNSVAAIDLATQKVNWQADVAGGCGQILVAGDAVLCQCGQKLVALNAKNGEKLWQAATPSNGRSSRGSDRTGRSLAVSFMGTSRVATDGSRAYMADKDDLYIYDIKNGGQRIVRKMDFGAPPKAEEQPPAGTPAAKQARAAKAVKAWMSMGKDLTKLTPANGVLYVCNASGVFAFDGKTGESLWSLPMTHSLAGNAVITDGILYFSIRPPDRFAEEKSEQPRDLPGLHAIKLP